MYFTFVRYVIDMYVFDKYTINLYLIYAPFLEHDNGIGLNVGHVHLMQQLFLLPRVAQQVSMQLGVEKAMFAIVRILILHELGVVQAMRLHAAVNGALREI